MSTESLAQRWLRQNTQAYAFKDAVYAHVDTALSRFSSVRPKTDIYTYDDGRTQLLLCLHGLLPISYRGASYNIPIAVWITRDYPREPPITYVVPTGDMLVRASKNVEVSGRCQIQYLQNWQRKSEGCSVSGLLEAMQEHFSREPPVYAKPTSPDSSQARPLSHTQRPITPGHPSARPPPPVPGVTVSQPPLSQSAPIPPPKNDDRPPLPLKPGQHTASSLPPASSHPSTHSSVRISSPGLHGSPAPLAARPPPPLPPQPPSDTTPPQYRNSPAPLPPNYALHERTPSMGGGATAAPYTHVQRPLAWSPDIQNRSSSHDFDNYRGNIPPYSPPIHVPQSSIQSPFRTPIPPSIVPQGSRHPPAPPLPPLSPPTTTQPQPHPPQFSSTVISPQGTGIAQSRVGPPPPVPYPIPGQLQPSVPPPVAQAVRPPPSVPPPDLLDAEDDSSNMIMASPAPAAAPPRPPNPELLRLHDQVHAKLSSELVSLSQAMASDAERLRAHQTDLLAGEPAIRDEMARLEAVRDVCRGVAGRLQAVVDDAERNVAEIKRRGDPEVDELVCSTTIVHDQLINLVAEDNAIEDTIYHLHRALNAGRIDLERFLRTTRILAEEQFMKRALIEKILGRIPMGESGLSMRPDWS